MRPLSQQCWLDPPTTLLKSNSPSIPVDSCVKPPSFHGTLQDKLHCYPLPALLKRTGKEIWLVIKPWNNLWSISFSLPLSRRDVSTGVWSGHNPENLHRLSSFTPINHSPKAHIKWWIVCRIISLHFRVQWAHSSVLAMCNNFWESIACSIQQVFLH